MALLHELPRIANLRLVGADRVRFLQGMLTNDIARLKPGEGCYAAMLTVKGRIIADMRVYVESGACELELDAALGDKVRGELDRHLFADDVSIEDHSQARAAVVLYGADAPGVLAQVLTDESRWSELPAYHFIVWQGLRVAADPALRIPGWRIVGERERVREIAARLRELGATPLDEDAYEVLRVEAGRPRYGVDMNEERLPPEARLDEAISHGKGCYVGQEVIVRVRDQGHLNWKLVGLRLSGETAAPPKTRLSAPGRPEAGEITSSVLSPRLGPIALAYVHRSRYEPGSVLTVHDPAGERTATVVELPFA